MSFQIQDKEGKALNMNEIDEIAAKFWNQPVSENFYAAPDGKTNSLNWKDSIGYQIHDPKSNWTRGWKNVKCSLLAVQTESLGTCSSLEEMQTRLKDAYIYLKPYLDLIDHFQELGLKPVKV